MGKRRYSYSRRRRKRPLSEKNTVLAVLVLLLVCAAAIPTIAWLTAHSDVRNQFEIGNTDVSVQEDISSEQGVKKDVCIKNDGNVPVYVRVAVSIYWKDKDGNILSEVPQENTDYIIDLGTGHGENWKKGKDGLYYYLAPLENGKNTENLFDEIKPNQSSTDEKTFYVDIAAQSIQAEPAAAVTDAWKDTVQSVGTDGGLTIIDQ